MKWAFPERARLQSMLRRLLRSRRFNTGDLVVLDRHPNPYACSFHSEVVTCEIAAGQKPLGLLCKYSARKFEPAKSESDDHTAYGYRGGVAYEAMVYESVLASTRMTHPRCYGFHQEPDGRGVLVIDFLDDAERINTTEEITLPLAARWIARFHAEHEEPLDATAVAELKHYDREYYLGWASRTSVFAGELHLEFPWLERVCTRFSEVVELLFVSPTVIHGEFTPRNVLLSGDTPLPVDWESAAVAAGEIDLVTLLEGWHQRWPGVVEQCLREYGACRWPAGTPADHDRCRDAAQLYSGFRWLGYRPGWPVRRHTARQRVDDMRAPAERLGLL